mmetsp:Transcript_10737/g.16549  ORF Transcript_10737/g.16549 Transcript_10737/m.16549 type:complete len:86 (+) Transcript_10737:676-933(+)
MIQCKPCMTPTRTSLAPTTIFTNWTIFAWTSCLTIVFHVASMINGAVPFRVQRVHLNHVTVSLLFVTTQTYVEVFVQNFFTTITM